MMALLKTIRSLIISLLVLSSSLMTQAQAQNPRPPADEEDYGHLERPIGLMLSLIITTKIMAPTTISSPYPTAISWPWPSNVRVWKSALL